MWIFRYHGLKLCALLGLLCAVPGVVRAADLNVYAAASLGGVLEEIAQAWEAQTGGDLTIVAAGSSAIARQIQAGAPADVAILANPDWMDVLEQGGDILPESRIDLLTNRLVVITGRDGRDPVDLSDPDGLSLRLGRDRLALALTQAVPAGIYARAALERLGLWDSVADRVVEADNVRTALALVASGAAGFGIVYATDAMAEPRVAVVAEIPADRHPPILYPAAIVAGARTVDAQALLDFLQSPIAAAIFSGHGFGLAGQD